MECPKCQTENPETKKFCRKCGAKLSKICPQCGAEAFLEDDFCGDCGHDLRKPKEAPAIDYQQPRSYTPKFLADKILTSRSAIEGERKLVTVLFADVAGFTPMSERLDPEDVHEIMDGCFRILMDEIHRYEGTVNEFRGDGLMALFGAPVSHEDHAQRACHAALAAQKALVPYAEKLHKEYDIDFKMRIGLNSGPVVVGAIGDDLRMDYTAQGDTANLAARMESAAEPGGVLVSEHTYRLAKGYFEFESLGGTQVKGKAEPVNTYQVVKPSKVDTRIGASVAKGLTRFVGRRRELETLKEAFDKAASGEGQVVGVIGEAGVGKSRLLLEFRNSLPKHEHIYLEGRSLHYGSSMPYLPILDALRTYLGIKEGEKESIIKQRMKERIVGSDESLKRCLAPIQELFSVKIDDEEFLKLEPKQKREQTFEALRDILIRGSQGRPVVIAVEDLHWIDKTTEEFLDYMIGWLPGSRIMLVLLYRPEYTHQWGSKSYYAKIGVGQLSTGTSAELVQAILEGGAVVPELRELILSKASGNPLYMEELTHSLLENGSVQREGDQYVLARKASEIQVPDTIQGIIAARMDRLEEAVKGIMQVASVIGREFAFRILHAITEMKEDLKSNLLNLQGLEFIYEKQLFPELEYIFRHALTQEVAYNSLLLRRRKEIHERIGQAIESLYSERLEELYEVLAYHYGRSDNAVKAVNYLVLANEKAGKAYAVEEAKAYFDKAMKLMDSLPEEQLDPERRISLLVNQMYVFFLLLKLPEYYELLTACRPLLEKIDNVGLEGSFLGRLGLCEWWLGHLDQARQTVTRAAQLCEAGGQALDCAYACMVRAWTNVWQGDFDLALEAKEEALRNLEQQFGFYTYARSLQAASWAYAYLGCWKEALEVAKKALKESEEISDDSMASFSACSMSLAYCHQGEVAQAIKYGQMALQKAPTPADKLLSQGLLSWVLCRSGEADKGIGPLTATVQLLKATPTVPTQTIFLVLLGDSYLAGGDYDKARETLQEAMEKARGCGMKHYMAWALRLLGEIALKTDPAKAAEHFEQSISMFQETKAENEIALACAGYGRLHKQQGNVVEARGYLTKALEIFKRLGTLIEPDKVRLELTELHQ